MGINKWGVSKVHKVTGSSGMQSEFKNKKGQPARNITSAEYAHVLKKTLEIGLCGQHEGAHQVWACSLNVYAPL